MSLPLNDSLAGLPVFALYLLTALGFLVLFAVLYVRITPYAEYRLIREGKIAPAISFAGAILGFVIPLASAISHSVSFFDMLIWSAIAFLVQVMVFLVTKNVFSSLVQDIENDRVAAGILLAVFALAAGILNAASMTY